MSVPYVLAFEAHVGRPIFRSSDGSVYDKGIRFNWSIRRADGSLLFRFESSKDAQSCLTNLFSSAVAS